MQISLSFGGNSWPISTADMNLGTSGAGGQCVGAIFDLSAGSSAGSGGGNPNWVVGDTYLVCNSMLHLRKATDRCDFYLRKTCIQSSALVHRR